MVLISCNEGEIPYLQYTRPNEPPVRIQNVREYFLHSPNQIPLVSYRTTNYLGQNPEIVRVAFSVVPLLITAIPGFSVNYQVPFGMYVNYVDGRAYFARRNRFYSTYPNLSSKTEAEIISSLYQGYDAFAVPISHRFSISQISVEYRPASEFVHPLGFYSNTDPSISTNRYPNGEPIYVQPTVKPEFGKWILQLFGENKQLMQTISFSSEPGITTGCLTQGCPPDTCEVVCGNIICCYGSDGIAVESFSL